MHLKQVILIIDPNPIILIGLQGLFQNSNLQFYSASTISDVKKILQEVKVDLIFLEVEFKGVVHLSMFNFLRIIDPTIKIIFFTVCDDESLFDALIKEENNFFLSKTTPQEEVFQKVLAILNFSLKENEAQIFKMPGFLLLSGREKQIVYRLIKGKRVTDISVELGLSLSTVSTYKNRIYKKLNVNSFPELIRLFDKFS